MSATPALAPTLAPAPSTAATAAPLTGTQPAETFVLIVQDERGLVYIDAVANARMQLHAMQAGGLIINDRRAEFRYSPPAREIALSLRQQFRELRKIDEPAPWHHAAWEHVLTALEDWNHSTGQLQRSGDFLIGTQVTASADNTAVGTITRFRQEGHTRRAFVTFNKPGLRVGGIPYLAAWCPLAELKLLVHSPEPVAA